MEYIGRWPDNKRWHLVKLTATQTALVRKNRAKEGMRVFSKFRSEDDDYIVVLRPGMKSAPPQMRAEIILTAWPMVEDMS